MATRSQSHETGTASLADSRDVEKSEPIPGITEDSIREGKVVPKEVLKHSHDADEAMKAFMNYQGEVIHIDEETNRRLLRKIDWNLMPVSLELWLDDMEMANSTSSSVSFTG
jgi:hypothetical protein